MRFHLCHIFPGEKFHGLLGYAEVIESIRWGLSDLGHDVTVAMNSVEHDATNIIFGAQMLSESAVERLPAGSIVYNLEQIATTQPEQLRPGLRAAAKRCQIWYYSADNAATWERMVPAFGVKIVPIGWAPTLERIPSNLTKEIDILLYGSAELNRLKTIGLLAERGHRVVYASGVYGDIRDNLIALSKVVLNINRYPTHRVFEIVRVSYLLGNGKTVVSDIYPEYVIDNDLRAAVAFSPLENIIETCERVLADPVERQRRETLGVQAMRSRDVRQFLPIEYARRQ